jgi:hypothetical protein
MYDKVNEDIIVCLKLKKVLRPSLLVLQPMFKQVIYLAKANVSSRLDDTSRKIIVNMNPKHISFLSDHGFMGYY